MDTFTVEITLPETVEIESRGQVTVLDVSALIATHGGDMAARGFLHGITQKVADAAASALKNAFEAAGGAKDATTEERKAWGEANAESVDAEALTLMESAARNLVENGWTTRRAGSATDPLDAYRAQVVRANIQSDKKSKAYKGYAAIDSKDQAARRAYLLDIAAQNAEIVDPLAEAARQADLELAKATAAIKF